MTWYFKLSDKTEKYPMLAFSKYTAQLLTLNISGFIIPRMSSSRNIRGKPLIIIL